MTRTFLGPLGLAVVAVLGLAQSGASQTAAVETGAAVAQEGPSTLLVEDPDIPYTTALGYNALATNALYGGDANTAIGAFALYLNQNGGLNTASGYGAAWSNTTGWFNTATGTNSLPLNTTGSSNTATGNLALRSNATGHFNTALGVNAGYFPTAGSYNLYLGANVSGAPTDTNTIRIGLAYDFDTGAGQDRTFIAGITGATLETTAVPVFIDANGRLGTVLNGSGNLSPSPSQQQLVTQQQATIAALEQQAREQQAVTADLKQRLARLEALVLAKVRSK